MNELNNSNNPNSDDSNNRDKNFDSELNKTSNFEAQKYSEKQEKYRQMMPEYASPQSPYIWRVGFGRRLAAYIIDGILSYLLLIIFSYFTGALNKINLLFIDGISYQSVEFINEFAAIVDDLLPLSLSISAIYYLTEVFFAATPGKMLLGIVIGTEDKKFAPLSTLLLRFIIKNNSMLFNVLFIIAGAEIFSNLSVFGSLVVFFGCFAVLSIKRQALHDIISKTAVYFKDELKQFDRGVK